MSLFDVARASHVVVAVLGLGCVAAVGIVARTARPLPSLAVARLLRFSRASLGLIILSGIVMNVCAHGGFHERWWFRLGALATFAAIGVLVVAGRALKADDAEQMRVRLERCSLAGCALLAFVATMMELKPW